MNMPRVSLILLSLIAGACGAAGPTGTELGEPPIAFRGYRPMTTAGVIYAEANYTDHASKLGIDLAYYEEVIPINLRVQKQGAGAADQQIVLSPRDMDLRLILADGTAIRPVDVDRLAGNQDEETAKKIRDNSFKGGLLDRDAKEGFVFFGLEPDEEFEIDGRTIRHGRGGVIRSFDLADSLLVFNLTNKSEKIPFYVGVQR